MIEACYGNFSPPAACYRYLCTHIGACAAVLISNLTAIKMDVNKKGTERKISPSVKTGNTSLLWSPTKWHTTVSEPSKIGCTLDLCKYGICNSYKSGGLKVGSARMRRHFHTHWPICHHAHLVTKAPISTLMQLSGILWQLQKHLGLASQLVHQRLSFTSVGIHTSLFQYIKQAFVPAVLCPQVGIACSM